MSSAIKITNFLMQPGKMANTFDWRKKTGAKLLTLDINCNRIGMVVSSHPANVLGSSSSYEDYEEVDESTAIAQSLEPIPMNYDICSQNNRKRLSYGVIENLQHIVNTYQICGFIVSWPVQKDGRYGIACGRVLHTLDGILQAAAASSSTKSNSKKRNIFTSNRRFCLWDPNQTHPMIEDEFGRSSGYGVVPSPPALSLSSSATTTDDDDEKKYYDCLYSSKQESNLQSTSENAVKTWDSFYECHWPQLYEYQKRQQQHIRPSDQLISNTNSIRPTASRNTEQQYYCNGKWLDQSEMGDTTNLKVAAHM